MEEKYKKLIDEALKIRLNAYTPHSNYKVGAALLCRNGKVYLGCNIENGAYSPTACAERVAFFDAVKNGERGFEAIAVVAGDDGATDLKYASPCGVCRQVMAEFCDDDFKIILPKVKGSEIEDVKIYTLDEIIPFRFKLKEFR
ncbi:MAG: cytidine deaminase [Lachnospiraceae bacterium]|nr:cytidine deaminase [Lachnospiraceae bacterium]